MTTSTRMLCGMLVGSTMILGGMSPAHAGTTPAQKCAAAKLKATGKKAAAKLKCYAKAATKGLSVDPACLTKAETKFSDAFTKAETKGGCVTNGDAAAIETTVDLFVAGVVAQLPWSAPVPTPTQTPPLCTSNCAPGSSCTVGANCQSLVCMAGVCQTASCTDGVKNGTETGVDCGGGGSCPLCASGQGCSGGSDCVSNSCVAGQCA